MVCLQLSELGLSALREACECFKNSQDTNEYNFLVKILDSGSVDLKDSERLSKLVKDFKTIIKGSVLVHPEFQRIDPSPSIELIKRREFLNRRQETREYNKMIYGKEVDPHTEELTNKGKVFTTAKNQASILLNVIVSAFACYGIGFYVAKQMKFKEQQVWMFSFFLFLVLLGN